MLILSVLKDKVTSELTDLIKDYDRLYFAKQEGERSASIEDIRSILSVQEISEDNSEQILKELRHSLVIFTGSFYFYPIVKRWISQIDQKN